MPRNYPNWKPTRKAIKGSSTIPQARNGLCFKHMTFLCRTQHISASGASLQSYKKVWHQTKLHIK